MPRVLIGVLALLLALAAALFFLVGHDTAPAREIEKRETAEAPAKPEAKLEPGATIERPAPRAPVVAKEESSADANRAATSGRTVRVRLLEKNGNLPLPRFRARVAGTKAELETDDNGWIEDVPVAGSTLDLDLLENALGPEDLVQTRRAEFRLAQASIARVEVDVGAELKSIDLPVPCGPTFTVTFDVPAGLAATDFALRLRCADARKAFDRALARVRSTGGLPWARFGACAAWLGGGPPWSLELSSDDGFWVGRVEIPTLDSQRDPPVNVRLKECGRFSGKVLTAKGEPVSNQWVQVLARGATFDSKDNRPRMVVTAKDGAFDAPQLAPGVYGVRIEADGQQPYETAVTIVAGRREEKEIRLAASLVPRASLRVRVESATGRYSKPVAVSLMPVRGGKAPASGKVQWDDEGGRRVGRVVLENLEVRDYRLDLNINDLYPTTPKDTVVQPADQEIVCRIEDDTPSVSLRVRAADETSGKPVPGARVEVLVTRTGKPVGVRDSLENGECVFEGLPTNAALIVRVDAPGRAPFWATENEVYRGDKEWTVDARLHEGWGTEVMVRGTDGKPIEGARILFDGVEVGTSNANGSVYASMRTKPTRAEVRYRDWKIGPSSALEEDGTFREWERWLRVVLTPP